MDSSIVSMTSVINAKELLSTCKLCGRDIKSILLVGQADYEGNVKNVGAGQLGGVPAVVLASDLYAIAALAGHPECCFRKFSLPKADRRRHWHQRCFRR